eukprot:SAG31_NODE_2165_length_6281_cov_2.028308_5_plen_222_part_00
MPDLLLTWLLCCYTACHRSMIDLSYGLAPFAHNDSAPHGFGFFNDMDVSVQSCHLYHSSHSCIACCECETLATVALPPQVLEVGNGEFDCATVESVEKSKAHFGMWSLMKSSLLLGTDLTFTANPGLKRQILSIIGNQRVIAINQDPLGVQARRVASVAGPHVAGGVVSNADVTLIIAHCDESRPTQRWRHEATSDGVGPLFTVDSNGTRWCTTSIAAGMW